MQEDIQRETKKSSKEMWLFLIFIDLVALCVFGFFIYNSFFGNIGGVKTDEPAQTFLEEVVVEDIKTTDEPVIKKEEVKAKAPEVKKEEKPEVKEEVKPEPKAEVPVEKEIVAVPAAKKAAAKRQSVFTSGSGKTRQVTFKYFGNAKKVSVVGGFTMRRPVAMKKSGGVWTTTLTLYPGEYKYMYVVDGKEIADPNAEIDDGRAVFKVK